MNIARFARLALVLCAPLALTVPAHAQNIVQDPSFETPDIGSNPLVTFYAGQTIGPWIVTGGSVDVTRNWQQVDGLQSVDMSGDTAGTIHQDLSTVHDETYNLVFSLAGNTDGKGKIKSLSVFWNGTEVPGSPFHFDTTGKSYQNMGWIDVSVPGLVATSMVTRLKFQSQNDSYHGPVIDNVRVTPADQAPILDTITPNQQPAGAPDFHLNAFGSQFAANAVVEWNEMPLSTSHVSATQLTATVPAADLVSAGAVSVTVVNPDGGAISRALPFTVTVTRIMPTFGTLTRDGSGNYHVPVSLQNTGYASAPNLQVTLGTLGQAGTSTTLPISFSTVAVGQTVNTTLDFPASAGTSGSSVNLHASGTYTGGTWSKGVTVTLP